MSKTDDYLDYEEYSDLGITTKKPRDFFKTADELYVEYLYDDLNERGVF